ncbi:hypothetical protein D3C78_389280 [compost metagenome]
MVRDGLQGQALEHQPGNDGCSVVVGIGQDHRHFLTPVACQQVARAADAGREQGSHLLQAGVASRMPIGVVVAFEMVDIDHQQSQRGAVSMGRADFLGQRLVKAAPVGKPGQRIVHRQAFELLVAVKQLLLGQSKLAFDRASPAHGANQQPANGSGQCQQRRDHQRRQQRLEPPGRKCFLLAQRDRCHQG